MGALFTQILRHHLRRWDLWTVIVLGWVMVATMTLLLTQEPLLKEITEVGGLMSLIEQSVSLSNISATQLLKIHVVRSGLVLVHVLMVVASLLLVLAEPTDDPRIARPILAQGVPRWNVFLVMNVAHWTSVGAIALLLGGMAGVNAYVAGVFQTGFLVGWVAVVVKLSLLIGFYRLIGSWLGGALGAPGALGLYGLCHLNGTFYQLGGSLPGLAGGVAYTLSVVLPAFQRISEMAPRTYNRSPGLLALDALTVTLFLLLTYGVSLLRFETRDVV